ncbi:MAG: beta/gamma crystallin-related protein, partial [Tahibacter sp.]
FGGSSLVVTVADPDLVPQGWNDKTSSIIVIDGQWGVYQDTNYSGTAWTVSRVGGPNGDGTYPDYSDWGGTNVNANEPTSDARPERHGPSTGEARRWGQVLANSNSEAV